jgi:hypothetical protein
MSRIVGENGLVGDLNESNDLERRPRRMSVIVVKLRQVLFWVQCFEDWACIVSPLIER